MNNDDSGFLCQGMRHYPDAVAAVEEFCKRLKVRTKACVERVLGAQCVFAGTHSDQEGHWVGGSVTGCGAPENAHVEVGFAWIASAAGTEVVASIDLPQGWAGAAQTAVKTSPRPGLAVTRKGREIQATIDTAMGDWERAMEAVLKAWLSARKQMQGN